MRRRVGNVGDESVRVSGGHRWDEDEDRGFAVDKKHKRNIRNNRVCLTCNVMTGREGKSGTYRRRRCT